MIRMPTFVNQMVQDDHWNTILHYSIFVRKFDWAPITLFLQIVKNGEFFFSMIVLGHVIWESLRLLTVQCRSAIDLRGPDCTQCWLWSSPNNGNVVNRARSLLSSLKKEKTKNITKVSDQWLQYNVMIQRPRGLFPSRSRLLLTNNKKSFSTINWE